MPPMPPRMSTFLVESGESDWGCRIDSMSWNSASRPMKRPSPMSGASKRFKPLSSSRCKSALGPDRHNMGFYGDGASQNWIGNVSASPQVKGKSLTWNLHHACSMWYFGYFLDWYNRQYLFHVRGCRRCSIRLPLLVLVGVGIITNASNDQAGKRIHQASRLHLHTHDVQVA